MLITTYYFACQKIFSFTYLAFVPVFFWMVNLKVFEMQIIRSHPRPTELWRRDPKASSPGNSDVLENLRTTALNSKMKLNWFHSFFTLGIIVLFFSIFLQFFANHWKWYFVGVWLQCQSAQYGSVNPACFDGQCWDQICVQKEKNAVIESELCHRCRRDIFAECQILTCATICHPQFGIHILCNRSCGRLEQLNTYSYIKKMLIQFLLCCVWLPSSTVFLPPLVFKSHLTFVEHLPSFSGIPY